MSGTFQGVVRQLSGSCQVVVRQLSGSCQVVVRLFQAKMKQFKHRQLSFVKQSSPHAFTNYFNKILIFVFKEFQISFFYKIISCISIFYTILNSINQNDLIGKLKK